MFPFAALGLMRLPVIFAFPATIIGSSTLADDLIEPYRPLLDAHVLTSFADIENSQTLNPAIKAKLVAFLHEDVHLTTGQMIVDRLA